MKKPNKFQLITTYRKSIVATLATAAIATSLLLPSKADASTFKDVKDNHWAYSAVEQAAQKKYIAGYTDGTFKPNGKVTRAEFAAFLTRLFDEDKRVTEPFTDVSNTYWAKPAIEEGIALGFINPADYTNNQFEPNKAMTRVEMARWLTNGLIASNPEYKKAVSEMANSNLTLIPIPEFFKGGVKKADLPYIGVALGTGLLSGYTDATFKPAGNTSRAEVAAILMRYVDTMKKEPTQFVGLNELREVAKTGSNMESIAGFTPNVSYRTFDGLRQEGYKFKNGIGTSYINRLLMIDMRDQKNPKGIFKNMFLNAKGETIFLEYLRPGGFYYGVEHKFIPAKFIDNNASYLYSNGRPELFTTLGVFEEVAKKFGFASGIHVDYKQLKVGQAKYMWFTGEIAPYYYEEYPNEVFISHTVNGKTYSFSKK